MKNVQYDRPMSGTLCVRLENGETWEATPEDLEKFGLVDRERVRETMEKALFDTFSEVDPDLAERLLERSEEFDLSHSSLGVVREMVNLALDAPDCEEAMWEQAAALAAHLTRKPA